TAAWVLATLSQATRDRLEGSCAALVTGPIHKGIINAAGIPFTGHTESLADLTQAPKVVMMLATEGLRGGLVTTHPRRAQGPAAIARPGLQRVLEVLHDSLRDRFALPQPRILVCGLNPHAGEGGHLGREEIDIIEPVLRSLCARGMDLVGPLP